MAKTELRGEFLGKLVVEFVDGNAWRLRQNPGEEFGMKVWTRQGDEYIIKPDNGFVMDFASIPMPIRALFPKTGDKGRRYGRAAAIHDFGYSYPGNISQYTWDKIFLLGMEIDGCSKPLRSLFYRAVSIGGGRYFGKPSALNKLRGTR